MRSAACLSSACRGKAAKAASMTNVKGVMLVQSAGNRGDFRGIRLRRGEKTGWVTQTGRPQSLDCNHEEHVQSRCTGVGVGRTRPDSWVVQGGPGSPSFLWRHIRRSAGARISIVGK